MGRIIAHYWHEASIPVDRGGPDYLWRFEGRGWPQDRLVRPEDVAFENCPDCQAKDSENTGTVLDVHAALGSVEMRKIAEDACTEHNTRVQEAANRPLPASRFTGARRERMLRKAEVLAIVPFKRAKLDRMIQHGQFPKGDMCAGIRIWRESVVYDALESLSAVRTKPGA